MASGRDPSELIQANALPRDRRVMRALRLIHQGFGDHNLTVEQLASRLHLSTSRLRQLFAQRLGIGPKLYIREVRLGRARNLLENSSLSVKEVMAAVGFGDASHFSRDYKKRFGILPSRDRQSS